MNILFCAEDGNNYVAHVEYVDWLRNMCSALTEEVCASVFATMKRMYLDDAKVRIGYKHMRAGIMGEEVFHRWLDKCCMRYMSILDL